MLKFLLITFLYLMPTLAQANDSSLPPELQGFDFDENILPIGADDTSSKHTKRKNSRQLSIIPAILSALPKSTAEVITQNISQPEQIFCYHIAKRPANYTGYTLNNFAIVDYCGELNGSQTTTTYEALFAHSPNIIMSQSSCSIEPRVMLRFTRGVDYTDVLLSSPCPSFTIFYAGRYNSFNIKQKVIDDIISQFEKNTVPFNSPSYLKQSVANGTLSKDELAEIEAKKQKEKAPIMNWQKKENTSSAPSTTNKPRSGWQNIKLKM